MCPGPILKWLPGPQPPGPGIPEVGDPVEQRKSKNQGFIFQMQTRSRRWGQSWSKLNVGSKSRRSSRSCHLACDHQRSESWDVVLNEQATSNMLKMWLYIHIAIWHAITRGLKFEVFGKQAMSSIQLYEWFLMIDKMVSSFQIFRFQGTMLARF